MNGWDENVWLAIVAGEGLLILVVLIWVIALTSKFTKLKKAHRKLIGETGVPQLEEVLDVLHGKLNEVEGRQQGQAALLTAQDKRLTALKGRVGVHRYNAFEGQGSDLSFAVAIVNDEQDGLVLSGIHSRDQTFLYAKPLTKGQSTYTLTPEEKTAINQAVHKE